MLERDKSTAPAVDGSRLPGVEEEGTDLQRGGKVSGVCFKEGLKVPDPNWVLYTDGTSLIKQGQWAVQLAKAEGAIKTEKRWWELPSGKLLVPEELAHTLVSQTHQATHLGHAACSQVNAASRVFRQKPPGIQLKGTLPLEHLGVDFTEMKPHRHYHYLLVMVCTFSRWVKAFRT